MSKALVCDQCGYSVALNRRGETDTGEEATWLTIETTWNHADLCTRACAIAYINDEDFVARHDAEAEAVMEVARVIASGVEEPTDG